MNRVRRCVEVEELAEDGAGAGAGGLGQRQGEALRDQVVVLVVGDHEGRLLGGGNQGSLGGGRVLALEKTLMSMVAQLPQHHAHDH